MDDLKLKGRIAEILEGGKVLHQDLFKELKSTEFGVPARRFDKLLEEMLLDGTVRKVLVEDRKRGRVEEYWELDE